jgi:long-chain fatty acid transport protein
MSHRSRLTLTAFALVAAGAFAPVAQASGFQLREQSPSSQGNAFAGVSAGGNDISAMFFNPAGMTQFSGLQFDLGATLIAPSAKMSDAVGTRTSALSAFPAYGPISGPTAYSNSAESKVAPSLYAMYSISNDLKLGLSVNAPFGFVTEYDSNFVGRYHALKTDLKIIDVAPSLAYRINKEWSVGVAFVARYVDATLTNAVDFGLIGFPATIPGTIDGTAKLTGNTWGYGYKAGVTYQPTDDLRLGLAYHGAMNMTLKGDIAFQYPGTLSAPAVAGFQAEGFRNGGGQAELNLPADTSFGFDYKVSSAFSFQGEACLTTWSRFKELNVQLTSNTAPPDVITNVITEEHWRDTWFFSLGGVWKVDPAWTLRAGLAHDQGAVTDGFRTPRIPDGDRTWVSLGGSYAFSKSLTVDVGYSHLFVKDSQVNLTTSASQTDPNFTRGNLTGSYKLNANVLAVGARFSF